MNLQHSLDFFLNQGPVFWAACASVGAGGALLITALYIYARRWLVRFQAIRSAAKPKTPIVDAAADGRRVAVTDTGYALTPSVAPPTGSVSLEESLNGLLGRLRTAGNELEEILAEGAESDLIESALKTSSVMVD